MTGDNVFGPVSIGFPSLIPPILAMVLALITKEVVSSLFIGVVSAAVIYSIAIANGFSEVTKRASFLDVVFTVMGEKIGKNVNICLFLLFIGGLIHLISLSGGSTAYGKWAKKAINGRRKSMFSTMLLGMMMFLDDYFNTITTGTVMRTVTEVNNVSKPKTAYIVHTVSTNMCIMIPLTSWAAAIVSQINDSKIAEPFLVFLKTIPFNIYSIMCFILMAISIGFDFDYGKMKFYEDNAKLGLTETNETKESKAANMMETSDKGTMWDLLLPIFFLVILSVYFMFSLGGMWDGSHKNLTDVLGDTDSSKALLFACFIALLSSLIMYVPRKIMTFIDWMEGMKEGMMTMIPTLNILVLAWTISGTSGELLETGKYIGHLVQISPIPPQLIPAFVFLIGMALAFSLGSAWSTFGLLIPIAASICSGDNVKYLIPSIASCLCGAVFGNNTSPIADTTVLVSTTVQCPFLLHVSTQLPYAVTAATASFVGFIVAGYTDGNVYLSLGVSVLILLLILFTIYFLQKKNSVKTRVMEVELENIKVDKTLDIENEIDDKTNLKPSENDIEISMNIDASPTLTLDN